ncbi:MAG: hypothetical protein ACLT2T_06895 [Bilophila wadsworthia]
MAKDPKQMTGYLYVLAAAVCGRSSAPFQNLHGRRPAPLEVASGALLGGICFFAQRASAAGRASL